MPRKRPIKPSCVSQRQIGTRGPRKKHANETSRRGSAKNSSAWRLPNNSPTRTNVVHPRSEQKEWPRNGECRNKLLQRAAKTRSELKMRTALRRKVGCANSVSKMKRLWPRPEDNSTRLNASLPQQRQVRLLRPLRNYRTRRATNYGWHAIRFLRSTAIVFNRRRRSKYSDEAAAPRSGR